MSEEKAVIGTLTTRSLIIGVVLSLILSLLFTTAYPIAHNTAVGLPERLWWPWFTTEPMWGFTLAIVGIMLLIPKKYRLNPAEIVFVLTCIVTVPILTGTYGFGMSYFNSWPIIINTQGWARDYYLSKMSPIFFPTDINALDPMRLGNLSPEQIPWAVWMVPIIFQTSLFILLRLFFLFGSAIIQKQCIEEEALAFPAATVTYDLLLLGTQKEEGQGGASGSKQKSIIMLVSFILSMLWWFFITPESSAWSTSYPIRGSLEKFVQKNPLIFDFINSPIYPGALIFDFSFTLWGWLFIMPTDVILTMVISKAFFYLILPPILVASGQMTFWGPDRGYYTAVDQGIFLNALTATTELRGGYSPIWTGFMLGIAITPLIIFRSSIIASIKAAVKGAEEGYFMSPRLLWAGWLLTGLAVIILFTIISIPIYYSVILLAIVGLWYLAMMRLAASGPGYLGPQIWHTSIGQGTWLSHYAMVTVGLAPFNQSSEAFNSAVMGNILLMGYSQGRAHTNPLMYNMEMYKLGELTRADRKKLTVGMVVNSIIPIVIVMPLMIYLIYTQGGWQLRSNWEAFRPFHDAYYKAFEGTFLMGWTRNTTPNWLTYTLVPVSTAVVILLSFARARYGGPLMYFSPVGLAWGIWDNSEWLMVGIVVLIIRFIVIRTGGAKMYNEKIWPIGIGMMAAIGIQWILRTIMQVLWGMGYIW